MKSWPTHSSNIIQGTKTDDAALMSLHVIHFQLVRDLGNHWNLIQSILAAHNEIWPYTIFHYLFWFQIVVITRIHKNTKKLLLASSYLSVCLSVCLSVRPHRTTRLQLVEVLRNFMFENFSKICRENLSFVKI